MELTEQQLTALKQFANSRGRAWKSKLLDCWVQSHYGFADDSASLQQVRNNLGPSWLMKFKLPR